MSPLTLVHYSNGFSVYASLGCPNAMVFPSREFHLPLLIIILVSLFCTFSLYVLPSVCCIIYVGGDGGSSGERVVLILNWLGPFIRNNIPKIPKREEFSSFLLGFPHCPCLSISLKLVIRIICWLLAILALSSTRTMMPWKHKKWFDSMLLLQVSLLLTLRWLFWERKWKAVVVRKEVHWWRITSRCPMYLLLWFGR